MFCYKITVTHPTSYKWCKQSSQAQPTEFANMFCCVTHRTEPKVGKVLSDNMTPTSQYDIYISPMIGD